MKYTHIGWIPCINGHLNFGLMKPGISGGFTNNSIKDPDNNRINFSYTGATDYHARRIILQSKVDWRDSKLEEDFDGSFRVFVLAEVSESDHLDGRDLTGSIYIYRQVDFERNKQENYEIDFFKTIHNAQDHYKEWQATNDKALWSGFQSDLNRFFDIEKRSLDKNSKESKGFFCVNFVIKVDGLIYIDNSHILNNSNSEYEAYIIARQAYYYLKYSLHSHKHHDHQADSLTTIVPIKIGCKISEEQAALKIIGQLKREITHIKRVLSDDTVKDYSVAFGILSYMNSLLETLSYNDFLPQAIIAREKTYLQSLENSFLARNNRRKDFSEIKKDIKNTARIYMGWYLLVLMAIVSLLGFDFLSIFKDLNLGKDSCITNFVFIFFIVFISFVVYKKLSSFAENLYLKRAGFDRFSRIKYNKNLLGLILYNFFNLRE